MAIGKKTKYDENKDQGSENGETILRGSPQGTQVLGDRKTNSIQEDQTTGDESSSKLSGATGENKEGDGISKGKTREDNNGVSHSKGTNTIIIKTPVKSDTDLLWDEICNGVNGKNSGIDMGFHRLNKYLGIRKSVFTIVGGLPGTGKTALVDSAYVLNPYDWYMKNKHTNKLKFQCIYYSMERKKTYKLAKWLCMRIWEKEGILIPVEELLSWTGTLSTGKQEIAKFYLEYLTEMIDSEAIILLDGSQNPTGIYKHLRNHASKHGRVEEVNEFEKRYIPNDDNLITNVVVDHVGKIKLEKVGDSYNKKANIDKLSEYLGHARDFYHYSPVAISQFNRSVYSDIQMAKGNGSEAEPTLESFKDTGSLGEDCDVALALFNPYRYKLMDYMGYDIDRFIDNQGNNKFRSVRLIKNSYGTDDIRIGLGFLGEVGLFREIPKVSDITANNYRDIVDNNFFR